MCEWVVMLIAHVCVLCVYMLCVCVCVCACVCVYCIVLYLCVWCVVAVINAPHALYILYV